jgi:adenylate cyclase
VRSPSDICLFEGFRLDRRRGVLSSKNGDGVFAETALGSRAIEILGVLAGRPGDLVSRAEIIEAVWPDTAVEDSNLNVQIAALRRVVDQGRSAGSCIQTVPGRGYRFVAPVTWLETAAPPAVPPIAPQLSIVVLPFTNLSDDAEQQYFADGITEDLTTDLSRIAGMLVISRNTAFTYKNHRVDTKQIGRELSVRYVLEGSVQRSGKQVRVTAQLIDAETDTHLWSERFDREMGDLFAMQNELTSRIAVALNLEMVLAEAARPIDNPDSRDYIFRGRAASWKPRTRATQAAVIGLFEHALMLDPQSVEARCWLADALLSQTSQGLADLGSDDLVRASTLVEQALAASPRSSLAHYARGELLRATGRFDEAAVEYGTVLTANRNWASAYSHLGWCKFLTGSIEDLIPAQQQAIRLSPRDPSMRVWHLRIGVGHLVQSRIEEAILWLEKSRNATPALPIVRTYLASAYALKGEARRAIAELANARRLSGDNSYSSIAHVKITSYFRVPETRALFEATYFAGLRKAGMPEN